MKANDQLRRWFEDDEALERAINGEYVSDQIFVSPIAYFLPQISRSHNLMFILVFSIIDGFYYRMEMEQVFQSLYL